MNKVCSCFSWNVCEEKENGGLRRQGSISHFFFPNYHCTTTTTTTWQQGLGEEKRRETTKGGERGDKTQLSGSVHPIYNLSRSSLGRKGERERVGVSLFSPVGFLEKDREKKEYCGMVQIFIKLTTLVGSKTKRKCLTQKFCNFLKLNFPYGTLCDSTERNKSISAILRQCSSKKR